MPKFLKTLEVQSKASTKKTILTHFVRIDKNGDNIIGGEVIPVSELPTKGDVNQYENIVWIGYDEHKGDVFKCYTDKRTFLLAFGVKGDEFE